MSANYKVFMSQIVDAVNDVIKETGTEDVLQIQSLQMMANGICICLKEALKDTQKGQILDSQLVQPWKSAKRCMDYCIEEASKRAVKNSNGGFAKIPVMIDSNMISQWIFDYYALDDKAQIEEEIRQAEEARIAAEEKKKKKAEAAEKKKVKLEKDLKKAENLIEKNFALGYKYTDKDIKLFESLRKAGLMACEFNSETCESRWYIKEADESVEDESEETDDFADEEFDGEDEDELDFMDAE